MGRLLAFIALLAIVIVAVGFYRGWFHVTETATNATQPTVTVTVDKAKIEQDKQSAKEKVDELGNRAKDAAK